MLLHSNYYTHCICGVKMWFPRVGSLCQCNHCKRWLPMPIQLRRKTTIRKLKALDGQEEGKI